MTLVTIDLGDVSGGHDPDDHVVIRAEAFRESPGGGITSTAEVTIPLVDGVGQAEVEPGPVVVAFRCRAVADTREKRGVVPDTGPVGIEKVLENAFEYLPPVVNHALETIKDAVAAEVDAIKWRKGVIPSSMSTADFNALGPGSYDMPGAAAQAQGIPAPVGGRLVRSWINATGAAQQDEYTYVDGGVLYKTARYKGSQGWGAWGTSPGDQVARDRTRTIPSGTDWNTLTSEGTWAANVGNTLAQNAPYAGAVGKLLVHDVRNSTGNIQDQVFIGYSPSQVWLRHRNSAGVWMRWYQIALDDRDTMQHAPARRSAVVEAGLKRRGGVVGTGGKAAIALRFDHHLQQFGEKVLPLLKQHRLPWGQMINAGNIGQGNDTWSWSKLAQECHQSGGEVWNHSWSHVNVTNQGQADREVTRGLDDLRAGVPSLWVDSWAPPGQTEYMGFTNQAEPEKFFDTVPGRMVLAQHAFVRGSYPGVHGPLSGQNLVGQSHITIDAQTSAYCQSAIRSARDTVSGLTFMLHSNYLDQAGYMTTAELSQVLAYIAQLRDAGEIVVLSNAGILMADANAPVGQTNFLSNAGAGTVSGTWSQSVSNRGYRTALGVPHEAEAWVMGSGSVTLRVQVASPTYPVDQSHTVTLVAGAPQRLSVLVTPPMDTTAITVSLTGSVTHTGIRYRPI